MILGLCLIGTIGAVWVITSSATKPVAAGREVQDDRRRAAQVRACPDRATTLDVERLLRAHPLPVATVARVLGTAAERRISSRVLWAWADRFGADRLVLAIDADLAERRLVRHLDAGTTPDWAALEVFADLNSGSGPGTMPTEELLDLDVAPAVDLRFDLEGWETELADAPVTDADLSQFAHLPPIFEPGLPRARSVAPPADAPTPPRAGGDDPWPMVA